MILYIWIHEKTNQNNAHTDVRMHMGTCMHVFVRIFVMYDMCVYVCARVVIDHLAFGIRWGIAPSWPRGGLDERMRHQERKKRITIM